MKPLLILMFILGLIAGILGVLAARQAYAVQVSASVGLTKENCLTTIKNCVCKE